MGRRNHNDVFVIGDELLDAEATASRPPDPAAAIDDQEPLGASSSGLGHRQPSRAAPGPRRLAALGLGAAAAALGVMELSSGSAKPPRRPEASARSAPATRPASRVARQPRPAAPPSSHHRRSERRPAPQRARRGSPIAGGEPEREPATTEAPESPPPPITSPPAPEPVAAPASPPPSPPPPSGGGGPAASQEFGFER